MDHDFWTKARILHENADISAIPSRLQNDIINYIHNDLIKNSKLLQNSALAWCDIHITEVDEFALLNDVKKPKNSSRGYEIRGNAICSMKPKEIKKNNYQYDFDFKAKINLLQLDSQNIHII